MTVNLSNSECGFLVGQGFLDIDYSRWIKHWKDVHALVRVYGALFGFKEEQIRNLMYIHLAHGRLSSALCWESEYFKRQSEPE